MQQRADPNGNVSISAAEPASIFAQHGELLSRAIDETLHSGVLLSFTLTSTRRGGRWAELSDSEFGKVTNALLHPRCYEIFFFKNPSYDLTGRQKVLAGLHLTSLPMMKILPDGGVVTFQ